MGDILLGAVALIVLVILLTRQKNREQKDQQLLRHSEEYRKKVGASLHNPKGWASDDERKIAMKEVLSDPRETAYINDSQQEEHIENTIKLRKLIEKNKVAYQYRELIQEARPHRSMPSSIAESTLIDISSRLYPSVTFDQILTELMKHRIFIPDYDAPQGERAYFLNLDRIYHPTERDEKGHRILIHNLTYLAVPKELF